MSCEIRKPLTLEQIMAHDGKLPSDPISRFNQVLEDASLRVDLLAAVRSLDDYEATIVLAYIKRLIKTREGQTTNG